MKYILSILLSVYIHKFGYMLRMEVPEYTRNKYKSKFSEIIRNWDNEIKKCKADPIYFYNKYWYVKTPIKQPKGKITKSKVI